MIRTIAFILLSFSAFAQINLPTNFQVKSLNGDNGLSQVSNYFRFEDSQGFMWITGNDAINRYDGSNIKVYNLNKYFLNCPNLQQAYGLVEDSNANLYLGSERGLYIYHRKKDKFSLQKIYKNAIDNVAMPFAFVNNKVYCFNRNFEINSYDVISKEIKVVGKIPSEPLNSIHIYQIPTNPFYYRWPFIDKKNRIWIIGKNQILSLNIHTGKIEEKHFTGSGITSLKYNYSYYDQKNEINYLATNAGILKYDLINETHEWIKSINNIKLDKCIFLAVYNQFMAFKLEEKCLIYDTKTNKHQWLWPNNNTKTRAFLNLKFDKIGRLWISDNGTDQKIITLKPQLLFKVPGELEKNNTNTNSIGFITELDPRNISIQNNWILDKSTNKASKVKSNQKSLKGFTDYYNGGNWYLNFNSTNPYLEFIPFKSSVNSRYIFNEIEAVGEFQDIESFDDKTVLISGSKGLFWLDISLNKLVKAYDLPNTFKINKISENELAVSYLDKNFILFKKKNRKLEKIKGILEGIQSFYLQFDPKKTNYWVGTNKGVFLLNKNYKILKHFDANNGLAGTFIYGLLLDNQGNAWCSHQKGLSSINAHNHYIINYDKNDGIQEWDFNNRSFFKDSQGYLYFGGVNGANYFKPPLKFIQFYKPTIYIDELWVNENTYEPEKNANEVELLKLSYQENNISIKALIKDLENGDSHKVIYRLMQNKTASWKFLPGNSLLVFNNLASGNYILELGVYNKFQPKMLATKKIKIFIETPFYNSIFFWILIGFAVAGIGFYAYNLRKNRIQKVQFEQELALEKQRTKITADLHDDIGSSLSSLQVNSAVATQLLKKDPEKAQEVLTKIENQSKKIGETLGDLIWSMKPGKEEVIDFGYKIKNFCNDILGSTHIKFEVKIDENLNSYLEEIYLRKNLLYITKEAINNAAKYSNCTVLKLSCFIKDNIIILKIEDNGIGFDPSRVLGNGIQNMRMRSNELNADFELISSENNGCMITLKIPVT